MTIALAIVNNITFNIQQNVSTFDNFFFFFFINDQTNLRIPEISYVHLKMGGSQKIF
jgi:hypothetical protein